MSEYSSRLSPVIRTEDLAVGISKNGARLNTQIDLLKELSVENRDAARCIKGQAEELSKTNKRMDALVADREKHQRRLDDRLEEVIESTQEAEKAFLVRIERAEKKRDAAYGEIAKLKRAAKGDQD